MSQISVYTILEERGFIEQCSHPEELRLLLGQEQLTVYAGFDPTSDSLHLGHLVPLMLLAHFQRHGHRVIVVIGGATAQIGDPSGRSQERPLLSPEQVAANAQSIQKQMQQFIDFSGENSAILVNNSDWLSEISLIDWLRDVGKHFSVNYMIAKETVKRRLSTEQGISYTEFSYMLLQAYDFLYLFDNYGCTIQTGGNDQWGNIIAGIDLIQKVRGKKAYAITSPLITTASGEKFGKSAGNAIWLDRHKTSAYQMYQYLVNTDDRDVEKYLRLFTFLPAEEINQIIEAHSKQPELRTAQHVLAAEVTTIVHGEKACQQARIASEILFGNIEAIAQLEEIPSEVPTLRITKSQLASGVSLVDQLVKWGLAASRTAARRAVSAGSVYLNNRRIDNADHILSLDDIGGNKALLRHGKRNPYLLVVEEEPVSE